MYLKSLSFQNFRNYRKKVFDFSSNTTLLVGKNGVGKTNILEGVYLLATGKSFRATKSNQMILYGEELARITGGIHPLNKREGYELELLKVRNLKGYSPLTAIDSSEDSLEVMLTVGEVQGQKVAGSRYLVNGTAKRKMDFVGKLRCVLFRPEDIDLVLGTPANRREYLNSVLEQTDREYRRCLLAYSKGGGQRNKLLIRIREGQTDRSQLLFWNKLLIKNGEVIFEKRRKYIEFVNERLKSKESALQLYYDKSVMSEKRLEEYADKEVWAGKTLVGPHRDDFMFIFQREGRLEKDLAIYGSRGEQRMAVFQVKLSELEFMAKREGSELELSKFRNLEDRPILLLDDVFSELDREHRREVFKLLDKQQTIISTADESLMPKRYLKKVDIVRL